MKRKWLFGLIVTVCFFLSGPSVFADTGKQEIKSIEEPTWLFKAGISKGKYHDRQDLGFILKENAVIKIRQTNSEFKNQLTVRLLSNGSKKEKSAKVGSGWVTISANSATVPFIDTPYGGQSAEIEYQIDDEGSKKPLPVFEEKSNQTQFFESWDKYDSDFALIKGKSFQLFLPKIDKEKVRTLKDFQSIDGLIAFYEDIFAKYNQYIGLDNSAPENRESQNRYFLKADENGAGGAYYGTNWTANTANNAEMWLKRNNWGLLHEIAHGYQAGFDGKGMYTGEVSNNLFGVQYQYDTYGKQADNMTWLFNFGKRVEVDNGLYKQVITDGKGYGDIEDHRYRLVLLTMMKQKAGKESFAKMYQEYRKMATQSNFKEQEHPLPDLMNKYYSETSRFDFSPALEKLKLRIEPHQAELHRARGYRPVASLVDVVPKGQLEAARKVVDPSILINSDFEVVDNQAIAPLGLKGNLTVKLTIDNIAILKDKKVLLKDGDKVVGETIVKNDMIQFTNVPNGIYSIETPNDPKNGYMVDKHYVYVKEQVNNATIHFKKINAPTILNEKIDFLGLGNDLFAEFETNLDEKKAMFTLLNKSPHSYYAGEKYASIKVLDQSGTIVYSKEIEGKNNQIGKDLIPFDVGYQVIIFHDETKNRLLGSTEIINKNNKENKLVMTKFGLKNNEFTTDTEMTFLDTIEQLADGIVASEEIKNADHSNQKSQLYAAIQYLNEPYKTDFFEAYHDLFKETEQENINNYLISLSGSRKKVFSELSVDIKNNSFSLVTFGGSLYPSNISNINARDSVSIIIKDSSGKTKYSKNYLLKTYYASEEGTTTLIKDDTVSIRTKAFVTVDVKNLTTDESKSYYKDITFKVTETGLEQVN